MEVLKCPSCGAHIKEGITSCEYCGSSFSKKETAKQSAENSNCNTNVNSNQTANSNSGAGLESFNADIHKLDKINWFVIAFIFMCCWPVGLVLTIMKLNKDKK